MKTRTSFIIGLIMGAALVRITSIILFSGHLDKEARGRIEAHEVHTKSSGGLTNPLLACEEDEDSFTNNTRISKDKLRDYIGEQQSKGNISQMSIYFRDLNNGPWVGINENERYVPASLAKTPVLITYFKLAEQDPKLLDYRITFSEKIPTRKTSFPPRENLEIGKSYTVQQLLEHMIVYSDNTATALLINHLTSSDKAAQTTFDELGVEFDVRNESALSVRSYASFFRVLYNASYINQDYSEKALKMLTASSFRDGLVTGVPQNVTVAHKFGERSDNGEEVQLHDCGIVYVPRDPYLLCIMTKGKDFKKLAPAIAGASKLVYDEVTKSK